MQSFQNLTTLSRREIVVTLENKASAWPEFVGVLAREDLNILGFMQQTIGDMTTIRLVVDDASKLEAWLKQNPRYGFFARDVLLVNVQNEQGALNYVTNMLSKGGITPKASYPVVIDGTPMLAFVVDDVNTAKKSLPGRQ